MIYLTANSNIFPVLLTGLPTNFYAAQLGHFPPRRDAAVKQDARSWFLPQPPPSLR